LVFLNRLTTREEEIMDEHQPSLPKFFDGDWNPPTKEEQRKTEKQRLIAEVKWHLKEFYRLLLKSSDKNSVEWTRVSALANKTLKEMEEEGICYFRKMPNGKTRVFKKVYCLYGPEEWKKCPEYFCPGWRSKDKSKCPHIPCEPEDTTESELEIAETAVYKEETHKQQ